MLWPRGIDCSADGNRPYRTARASVLLGKDFAPFADTPLDKDSYLIDVLVSSDARDTVGIANG